MTKQVNKLTIGKNVPKWAIKWIAECKELVLPEWEVTIDSCEAKEELIHENALAMISYLPEYLTANIKLSPLLKDDYQGRYSIVHEFCHPVMAKYFELVMTVFDLGHVSKHQHEYDSSRQVVEELQRKADEHATTKMARSITELLTQKFSK